MNKKKWLSISLLLSIMGLTACTPVFHIDSLDPSANPSSPSSGGGSEIPPSTETYDLEELKLSSDTPVLKATGTQKILVIPVQFSDYTCDSLPGGCEGSRANIETAFFGDTEETGWESVASYYHKSSYGKLTITGVVGEWFQVGSELAQAATNTENPEWIVLRAAVADYRSRHGNLQEYDQNSDGYLDGVWLVNSAPISRGFQWAFTFWDYQQSANHNNPIANVFAWASYHFIDEGGYDSPDAHTYIHETGHMLGLDDYYTYDDNDWGPTGGLDMMDANVGDHSAFSKGALGWVTPTPVTEAQNITLRPFATSGESLLIGSGWNGTMFDEYLLLEYYTPTGLNALDASVAYAQNGFQMFTENGLKVYHVDARLCTYRDQNGWRFSGYTDTIVTTYTQYTDFAHSNTRSSSVNGNFRLLHLLESSGSNSFQRGAIATNATLFQAGDTFGLRGPFSAFTFNDTNYSSLPFGFEIVSLNNEGVTISFSAR